MKDEQLQKLNDISALCAGSIYQTVTQEWGSNTQVTVAFNQIAYDYGGNAVPQSGGFVYPVNGIYKLTANIEDFLSATAHDISIYFTNNSATILRSGLIYNSAAASISVWGNVVLTGNAGSSTAGLVSCQFKSTNATSSSNLGTGGRQLNCAMTWRLIRSL